MGHRDSQCDALKEAERIMKKLVQSPPRPHKKLTAKVRASSKERDRSVRLSIGQALFFDALHRLDRSNGVVSAERLTFIVTKIELSRVKKS